MRLGIERFGWRFYLAIHRLKPVKGMNSILPSGKHIIMWDFDSITEEAVVDALIKVQDEFHLPRIWLLNTGLPNYWHAFCFKLTPWADLVHILAATEGLDRVYFAIGIVRGYFTLRYSRKKGRQFEPAIIIPGYGDEDIAPFDFKSFITYKSARK